jgi:uncharacterized protein (TIGR02284 family)
MENKKTIDILNDLIQINSDRMEGYETASKETEEEDLKDLFSRLITTSQQCKAQLSHDVMALGGTPAEGTKTSGKFFRVWMDVKAALTGRDRKFIIDSCEYGEDQVVALYESVLEDDTDDLSSEQVGMIGEQLALIKTDLDTVKEMKNMLV